jgi:hypothetical protein
MWMATDIIIESGTNWAAQEAQEDAWWDNQLANGFKISWTTLAIVT